MRLEARGARPPCGDPAPGELVLDGTDPASALSFVRLGPVVRSGTRPGAVTGRRPRAVDCSSRRGRSRRPLTPLSPSPRRRLSPARSRRAKTASTTRASTRAASTAGAPFIDECSVFAHATPEPATGSTSTSARAQLPTPAHRVRCARTQLGPPRHRGHARERHGPAPPVDFCNRSRSASTTTRSPEPRPPRRQSPDDAAAAPANRRGT